MEHTTISLPEGLHRKAKDAGLNVSRVCATAIARTLSVIEEKEPGDGRQTHTPAVSSHGVTNDLSSCS
jgi:hypothetical protein